MTIQERLEKCVHDDNNQPLVCYGCSHSAAYCTYIDGTLVECTDFPGKTSGERPCFFCVRNPEREQWQKDFEERNGSRLEGWYDNSVPYKVTMDCYHEGCLWW
jgi:hypothetical protein